MLFQLLPRIIGTSGDRQPGVALVVQHTDPHIARRGIAEEDELDVGAHRRHGLGIPHCGNVVERLHARRSTLDAQQGQQRQTDFIDVVAWRHNADFLCKHFAKGGMVAIQGRLQTRQYQDRNGNKRTAVEVVADSLSFAGSSKKPGGQAVDEGGEAPPSDYRDPAPAYSQGDADDFAVIDDNDDLPF